MEDSNPPKKLRQDLVKPRIYRPYIEKYYTPPTLSKRVMAAALDDTSSSTESPSNDNSKKLHECQEIIYKEFQNKIEKKSNNLIYTPQIKNDAFYFGYKFESDFEAIYNDKYLKARMECKELRTMNLQLINTMRTLKLDLEYKRELYYDLTQKTDVVNGKIEKRRIVLLANNIKQIYWMIELYGKIREMIVEVYLSGESDYNMMRNLYVIANKRTSK